MEEQAIKKNNTYLIFAIILYISAAIMIPIGIYNVVKASDVSFNNFNQIENNFGNISNDFPFEFNSNGSSSGIALGVMLIVGGGISIFIASILLAVHFHKNHTFSNLGRNMIDKMMDTIAYTKDAFSTKILKSEKNEDVNCEYCGSIIKANETKCQNCGATKKIKK